MFEVYRHETTKLWGWRMKSLAGKQIAECSEFWPKRSAALASIHRVQDQAKGAAIVETIS